MDRTAAFLSRQEYKKAETIATDEVKDGWLTEAMIANQQGLSNYTKDESQKQQLADFLEGLPSRPHERKDLADKGWLQYYYVAKELSSNKYQRKHGVSASAEAECKDHQMFESIMSEMENPINFTKGPPQKKPKPTPQPKLLSPEDECKLNFLKDCKSLQNKLINESKLFNNFLVKGKSLLPDKTSGVTNELLAAVKTGVDELRRSEQTLVELTVKVQMLGSKNFKPKTFECTVQKAKDCMDHLDDIKQKATRIIGK